MDALRTLAAIIGVLITVVVVHELGHYLVAKWSGIKVDEFSVGFGPRLLWRRRGETLYALRAIPAGGFVRLAGMTGLPEEKDPGPRAFWRASIPRRTATILAGGVFNLVFAGFVYSMLAIPGQASSVSPYGALAKVGMHDGDTIVAVDGHRIDNSSPESVTDDLHAATDTGDGRPLTVEYATPSGQHHTVTVKPVLLVSNLDRSNHLPDAFIVDTIEGKPVGTGTPQTLFDDGASVKVTGHTLDDPPKPVSGVISAVTAGSGGAIGHAQAAWRFGFAPGYDGNSLPFALGRGYSRVPQEIGLTFSGLWDIITTPTSGGVRDNLTGPVGVVRATGDAAQAGWRDFLDWVAFLSLNLGIFNLLPIPFLDGGRFVFIALEGIRRRRVDPRVEQLVHAAGLMLILGLVLYVTVGDIGGHS